VKSRPKIILILIGHTYKKWAVWRDGGVGKRVLE
jgi:hypothetical protein